MASGSGSSEVLEDHDSSGLWGSQHLHCSVYDSDVFLLSTTLRFYMPHLGAFHPSLVTRWKNWEEQKLSKLQI